MKKSIMAVLVLAILISMLPMRIEAAEKASITLAPVGQGGYKTMTTSEMMLDVLKVTEGFSATPYWDVAQWTVGFGSYAGSRLPNVKPDITLTPEEAEVMLKQQLASSYEKYVNNYFKKLGRQPTQNQFDALVSFTYNLGSGWMSGSMLNTWLNKPTTEMDMVNAMGRWVRADGKILYGLVQRRVREAIIFLKGEYYLPYAPTAQHCVKTNLKVVSNDDLPYYASVIYQYGYDDGTHSVGQGHEIGYFAIGSNYNGLDIPTRDGYQFSGWQITKRDGNRITGGKMLAAADTVIDNLELTAVWNIAPTDPSDPVDPDDPNPEEPTDPDDGDDITPPDTEDPTPPVVEHPFPFEDVPVDSWYRLNVEFVYDMGLMNGLTDTQFAPDGTMSRGMLVTVLYRLAGSPEVAEEAQNAFSDTAGRYYTDPVAWAKANGIVNGVTETTFCPDREITRQEAVAILYRYCTEHEGVEDSAEGSLEDFSDADKVSAYARTPMLWATSTGLIAGIREGDSIYLDPSADLNRAQSATLLTRLVTEILS